MQRNTKYLSFDQKNLKNSDVKPSKPGDLSFDIFLREFATSLMVNSPAILDFLSSDNVGIFSVHHIT